MAASGRIVGGYNCELFVTPVPDDFKCGACKKVAREPYLADCCGEHYCKRCIDQVIEDRSPCPSCKQSGFSVFINKRVQKKILALEVECAMKGRGCGWKGSLEHLDAHLDVDSGTCGFVDVDCPNKCVQFVQKRDLATHLDKKCVKRDFFCQYCNFKSTYEDVSNNHWPVCQLFPIPCPNGCEILALERGDLDAHIQLCSLEEVTCDFSYAGCHVRLVREEMERHLADNLQRHVLLMNKAVQEKVVQLETRLEQKDEQVRKLEDQLQKSTQRVVKLEKLNGLFTVLNFQKMKNDGTSYGVYLYTHPGGYKVDFQIVPNGWRSGRGTHVSMQLCSCGGDNYDQLKWPAKCTVTLQLLNQHQDQDHVTMTGLYQWTVTSVCIWSNYQLIAHKDLEWNAAKKTQYLKDDCLRFRATFKVHSM